MTKLQALLLIIFLSVADIYLYRIGLLPLEPSFTLIPLLISTVFLFHKWNNGFNPLTENAKYLFSFFIFSITFSVLSEYENIWYVIVNHLITLMFYISAMLYFSKSDLKINKVIFLGAFFLLGISFLDYFKLNDDMFSRSAGFAENPNSAALRLVLLYIAFMSLLKNKAFIIFLTILAFVLVFLTLSRSGLIFFVVSILILLPKKLGSIREFKDVIKYSYKFVILGLFALFLFLSIIPFIVNNTGLINNGSSLRRISQISGEGDYVSEVDSGEGGRLAIAEDYLDLFTEKPIGYGTGMSSNRRFYDSATHNMFLRIGIDYGVIGLIVLLFFIFNGLKSSLIANDFYRFTFFLVVLGASVFTNSLFENRTFIICLAFLDYMYREKQNVNLKLPIS